MKGTLIGNKPSIQDATLQAILRIEKKIDRLQIQSNLEKDYLTTQEACVYLGCTRSMIWKMVNAGTLTKLKKENGRTYYATHELKKYVESPTSEINS